MSAPTTPARLRVLLRGGMVLAPFVYDGLSARIAEAAGFECLYLSGFGSSMAKGFPDVGLLTGTEMVQNAGYVVGAVTVPVIADADTGYGNAINVQRTVRDYQRAGVAGIHIEDQVFPKKCGFFKGKDVIPMGEAVSKLRAALDARTDPDFLVIARCDALAIAGWDETERRCRAYAAAGADMVFVDGIDSLEHLDTYTTRLR
ncbi:MAG: isocitrate lyase/PEP mutase family protein, partial [Chloroflexota bacterium]